MATILLTGAGRLHRFAHLAVAAGLRAFDVVGVDDFRNSSPACWTACANWPRARWCSNRPTCVPRPHWTRGVRPPRHRRRRALRRAEGGGRVHHAQPLAYYANNIGGLVNTCQVMQRRGVRASFLSSSATVYGDPQRLPLPRRFAAVGHQPHGADQAHGRDHPARPGPGRPRLADRLPALLQPGGRARGGRIGEDPRGTPNNLMPYVAQVAWAGRKLQVFGNDYPRPTAPACATTSTSATCRGHGRAAPPARPAGLVHRQPGHRPRLQRAGPGARLRAASGRARAVCDLPRRPATWPPAGPTPAGAELLGWRAATTWTACAPTAGAGNQQPQRLFGRSPDLRQPVIMAGGSGTRLWPLSRAGYPKQFLVLSGSAASFQQAKRHAPGLTRQRHRSGAAPHRRQRGAPLPGAGPAARGRRRPGRRAAGTDGAQHRARRDAGRAAGARRGADPVLVVTPADQTVTHAGRLHRSRHARAVAPADGGSIAILGITPTGPETGYGYIRRTNGPGEGLGGRAVRRKPEPATRRALPGRRRLLTGTAGMFVLKRLVWMGAGALPPDIASRLPRRLGQRRRDASLRPPGKADSPPCPAESVDYAVMERCPAATSTSAW